MLPGVLLGPAFGCLVCINLISPSGVPTGIHGVQLPSGLQSLTFGLNDALSLPPTVSLNVHGAQDTQLRSCLICGACFIQGIEKVALHSGLHRARVSGQREAGRVERGDTPRTRRARAGLAVVTQDTYKTKPAGRIPSRFSRTCPSLLHWASSSAWSSAAGVWQLCAGRELGSKL